MAAGTISTALAEWLLVALIAFSLVFEFALHRLEHWIERQYPQLKAVTRVLYRELMLLGLVSFIFIMYETIAKPVGDTVLSFEFAHVFIFLLAIFYTVVLVCAMAASLRMSKRWKYMEQIDLVRYLNLKERYTMFRVRVQSRNRSFWRFIPWWFPNFKTLLQYRDLHELMAFHDIRFQVIYYRNLPEHFRFATFLRRIKAATFLQLVETHWSMWVILLLLLLIDATRRSLDREHIVSASTKLILRASDHEKAGGEELSSYETERLSPSVIIGGAVFLLIFCQVLSIKIRRVYWKLTKHPRVYYKDLEPHILSEEQAPAAEREHSLHKPRGAAADRSQDMGEVSDDEGTDLEKDYRAFQSDTHVPRRVHGIRRRHIQPSSDPGSSVDCTAQSPSHSSAQHRPVHSELSADPVIDTDSAPVAQTSLKRKKAHRRGGHHGGQRELPREYHETTRHRSLDLPRAPAVVHRPLAVAAGMHHTSVAHAAASAAGRRSLEAESLAQRASLEVPGGPRSRPELDSNDDSRRRFLRNPRILSYLSSRRSIEAENPRTSVEYNDSLGSQEPHSIEKERVLSPDEHVERSYGSEMDDTVDRRDTRGGHSREGGVQERYNVQFLKEEKVPNSNAGDDYDEDDNSYLERQESLAKVNATILKNRELQEAAHNAVPPQYPRLVTKLIPRLGRVASPVEKLFWFGSHRFYLYCVEFTLFFSTVIVAAAFSSLALQLLYKRETTAANIVSFVLAPLTLTFVLLRIAGIIKKYIFIIHNAGLVPETVAINAIQNATKKGPVVMSFEDSDASEDEMELGDEQSARERRRTLGRYFRSEAEAGNVTGVDAAEAIRLSEDGFAAERRARKRSLLMRLRSRRTDKFAHNTLLLPV